MKRTRYGRSVNSAESGSASVAESSSATIETGPSARPEEHGALLRWLLTVREGLGATNRAYPFLAYGTDWLAFAHLVIAVLFVGPLRDPVRNRWVIEWGMIACAAVVPFVPPTEPHHPGNRSPSHRRSCGWRDG